MSKLGLRAKNFIILLIALSVMFGIILSLFSLVQDILTRPATYFQNTLSPAEAEESIVQILIIIVSVLISYVLYLLLATKNRAELMTLKAIEELSVSREQFRQLYEGAPVPYIILDRQGKILETNKAAWRFFGATERELKNENLFRLLSEANQEGADKLRDYYKSNVPIDRKEAVIKTNGGLIKWVELSIFEMRDLKSSATLGLATILDVTEQKRLDKAKTEFLSLASHQLRTPIATTKWYTEMLISGDLGELSGKQMEYLRKLYAVNEGMVSLVDTFLNVSRLEAGTLLVDLKPTNVLELVDSVLQELSALISQKGLRVEKHVGGALTNIKSDPKLLRIVIQNLVANAVKYTPSGGVIRISSKASGDQTITVEDSGIGIPKAEQDRVFQKMFRAGNTKSLEGSYGTGLGLYLVKSIMNILGGEIKFQSEEGRGSAFVVKLS